MVGDIDSCVSFLRLVIYEQANIREGLAQSVVDKEHGLARVTTYNIGVVIYKLGDVACACTVPLVASKATWQVGCNRYAELNFLYCEGRPVLDSSLLDAGI